MGITTIPAQTNHKFTTVLEKAMATLARSASTFRRQGSSGLIWDDKLVLQREEGRAEFRELRPCQSAKPGGLKAYSHSTAALAACPRSRSVPTKSPNSFKSKFLKMFRALFRKSTTTRKSDA